MNLHKTVSFQIIARATAILIFLIYAPFVSAHITKLEHKEQVVLGGQGFIPKQITIKKGATVEWLIEGGFKHWPASNNHPQHTIYPEGGGCLGSKLDACESLSAGDTYTFKFDKVGKWGIHDHNYPRFTMIVEVVDPNDISNLSFKEKITTIIDRLLVLFNFKKEDSLSKPIFSSFSPKQKKLIGEFSKDITPDQAAKNVDKICSDFEGSTQRDIIQCFSETFYKLTQITDADFGFKTIFALQKINPRARSCHLPAHGIGWAAFEKDPEHWKETIGKTSLECNTGAIHGIMERFTSISGQKLERKVIPEICKFKRDPGCYHAVGHMLLVETNDNLDEALDLCREYPQKNEQRHYCLNGAFMERMIAPNLFQHGFVNEVRRGFWFRDQADFEKMCRSYSGEDADACWTEISHAATINYKDDPKKVLDFCNSAQTESAASYCRKHSISQITTLEGYNLLKIKPICELPQKSDPSYKEDCYMRIVSATVGNLAPADLKVLSQFCSALETKYKLKCFTRISNALTRVSTPKKDIETICSYAPDKYKETCLGTGVKRDNSAPNYDDRREVSGI